MQFILGKREEEDWRKKRGGRKEGGEGGRRKEGRNGQGMGYDRKKKTQVIEGTQGQR